MFALAICTNSSNQQCFICTNNMYYTVFALAAKMVSIDSADSDDENYHCPLCNKDVIHPDLMETIKKGKEEGTVDPDYYKYLKIVDQKGHFAAEQGPLAASAHIPTSSGSKDGHLFRGMVPISQPVITVVVKTKFYMHFLSTV